MKKIVKIAIFCLIFAFFGCNTYAISEDSGSLENGNEESRMKDLFCQSNYIGKDSNGNFLFEMDSSNSQIVPYDTQSICSNTSFVVVPSDEEDRENWENAVLAAQGTDYNTYGEQWDASRSCKIYTTVYYSKNGNYASLKYITGGYTKSDHTISVTSQQVDYSCAQGNGQDASVNQGSNSSWTIYPPSYWQPLNVNVGWGIMGCTLYTTVHRTAGSWTITLPNNPINTY